MIPGFHIFYFPLKSSFVIPWLVIQSPGELGAGQCLGIPLLITQIYSIPALPRYLLFPDFKQCVV